MKKQILHLALLLVTVLWIVGAAMYPIINSKFWSPIMYFVPLILFAIYFLIVRRVGKVSLGFGFGCILSLLMTLSAPFVRNVWNSVRLSNYFGDDDLHDSFFEWQWFDIAHQGHRSFGLFLFAIIIPTAVFVGIMILVKKEKTEEK